VAGPPSTAPGPSRTDKEFDVVDSTDLAVVEGKVLDGPRFPNLYRLLDLERDSVEQAQRLSMLAAGEIYKAFEADEWKQDKQTEWDMYVAEHGYQPQWSPVSERSFVKWLQVRAEQDGHPFLSRGEIQNLRNAAECVRIISNEVATRVATLPQTEGAWRPAAKLLKAGFRKQIGAMVERAAEIAEEQGLPEITQGAMSAARTEIWRTDPEIQAWVTQPGQTVDARSAHDRVVTALNDIKRRANDLRKELGDNPKAWSEFLDGLAEIR
jgi:hypothetical protein